MEHWLRGSVMNNTNQKDKKKVLVEDCPFPDCFLSKNEQCPHEYKEVCNHMAEQKQQRLLLEEV